MADGALERDTNVLDALHIKRVEDAAGRLARPVFVLQR
jgi:hypothetical protein